MERAWCTSKSESRPYQAQIRADERLAVNILSRLIGRNHGAQVSGNTDRGEKIEGRGGDRENAVLNGSRSN